MKTKLGLSIILAFVLVQSTFGQTFTQDTFYRSAGIDATFINNFLPLDNPIGSSGKYLFHYIKFDENHKFTKQALNILVTGAFEKNESEVDQNNARIDLDYKIGRGKRKNVFKKGYVLYGAELGVDYFMNKISNVDPNDPLELSSNTNAEQSYSVFLGPVVGVGYHITKRISLYTEAGFYFRGGYGIDTFKSELSPELDFTDKRIAFGTSFFLPRSIILFFHF